MYSFKDKGANNGTRTFYSLYVEVIVADKIGRKGRTPFFTGFQVLARPYKLHDLNQQDKDLHISFQKLSFCS